MHAEIIRESETNHAGRQAIPVELFLEGEPVADVWLTARIAQGADIKTGIWVGQPGKIRVPAYPSDEVFTVLSGLIELTSSAGESIRIGPGESCLIRKGWSGIWHTAEPTRKCYVIFNG